MPPANDKKTGVDMDLTAGWNVVYDILEDLIRIGEIKDPYAEED